MFDKVICRFLFCFFLLSALGCSPKAEPQTAAGVSSVDRLMEAEALMYERNYIHAIDIINSVIESEGPSAYALTLRGIAFAKTNKPNFAIMDLIEATRMDYSPTTLVNVGNAERMYGHCERAADAYQKALVLAPNDVEIMTNLASAYVCYGALDLAEAVFQKVYQFNQNNEILETNRAIFLAIKEEWGTARESAELAIRFNASYAPAYKVLSFICGKTGDSACYHEAERQHKIASLPKSANPVRYKKK